MELGPPEKGGGGGRRHRRNQQRKNQHQLRGPASVGRANPSSPRPKQLPRGQESTAGRRQRRLKGRGEEGLGKRTSLITGALSRAGNLAKLLFHTPCPPVSGMGGANPSCTHAALPRWPSHSSQPGSLEFLTFPSRLSTWMLPNLTWMHLGPSEVNAEFLFSKFKNSATHSKKDSNIPFQGPISSHGTLHGILMFRFLHNALSRIADQRRFLLCSNLKLEQEITKKGYFKHQLTGRQVSLTHLAPRAVSDGAEASPVSPAIVDWEIWSLVYAGRND
ncbi:uncharacterized protein LOC135232211 [Loxodonta africana]|uniref:uncharacterized protein LOC135232211 n=1 Tax=Loxodonta africana TaxID=9785 RepID=UPI0030CFE304